MFVYAGSPSVIGTMEKLWWVPRAAVSFFESIELPDPLRQHGARADRVLGRVLPVRRSRSASCRDRLHAQRNQGTLTRRRDIMTHYQRTAFGVVFVLVIALCGAFLVASSRAAPGRLDLTEAEALHAVGRQQAHRRWPAEAADDEVLLQQAGDRSDRAGPAARDPHVLLLRARPCCRPSSATAAASCARGVRSTRRSRDAEEEADRLGIQRLGNLGDDGLYFGMAVTSGAGAEQAVKFFDPSRQSQIEYQIAEAIDSATKPAQAAARRAELARHHRRRDERHDAADDADAGSAGQPSRGPRSIGCVASTRSQDVAADTDTIDPTLDYLLVVHPKSLAEQTLYAIDQFVMNGGELIVFVDPYAPIADQPQQDPSNPFGGESRSVERSQPPARGVRLQDHDARSSGDPNLAMNLPDRRGRSQTAGHASSALNQPSPERRATHLGVNERRGHRPGTGRPAVALLRRPPSSGRMPPDAEFVSLLQTTAQATPSISTRWRWRTRPDRIRRRSTVGSRRACSR